MSVEVAQTILQQLGGNRFIVMTGAKHFGWYPDELKFQIPASWTKNKARYVSVKLTADDTYTVTFKRLKRVDLVTVGEFTGIYADMLQKTFTDATGLDTHL